MTQLNLTGCKKRKRGERVFKLRTFCEPGYPVEFNGLFRQNIRALIELGTPETNLCSGMHSWSFQLELHQCPSVHIVLLVIEESIERSAYRNCNHCKYMGWGHHMICSKKFHFVVSSRETMPVIAAGISYEGSCRGSDQKAAKSNFVGLQGYLMHGVLHSNGFGHLLCVNGVEKGAELAGHEIMDLWDRICTALRARKVSINDVARKRGMDLRLLHGVAYGEPWFGRWGYRFSRGSYGVTEPMYRKAIEVIQSIPLCLLVHHFGCLNHEIPAIFTRYQALSGHSLVTLGHLFHFMIELKVHLPQENHMASDNSGILFDTACRWSPKRIEMATRVIVEFLRKAEFKWVSRQEVRDAARAYIGDTGLLDFVLKSLGNHIVGNYMVRRSLNPVTKVLEYCLEDISSTYLNQEGLSLNDPKGKACHKITRAQLMNDIAYLYRSILNEQRSVLTSGIFTSIPLATRIILDSKGLIKNYGGEVAPSDNVGVEGNLTFLCTALLKNKLDGEEEKIRTLPPYELIILPLDATIEELKKETERVFRETYWGLRSFIIESISGVNAKESDMIFRLVELCCCLVMEGRMVEEGIGIDDIYESGRDDCIVDCPCGAKEDDGERMISCDICEVWQHTRCVRIPNGEDIPHIFLCSRCEHDIVLLPSLP
ncbi:PREDICTED: PHD finger protein PERSISTENT TAPETAL CELL 1 [Nelumbo nucifera]|uniref:Zinc finger PHD-type domain-containing protein n=2 Tax=Nelumbo nucifera TaxID=4432 RepID=A0A822YM43_NELNU|nr:PREDICTED: PHD finger protein PERSISTENT TAPETAL CELL 1 [Nelumbo nucifera]DAD32369.1 TPA_asm: hypothetical protein HUJ06_011220 [Nelumbo nucifera]